MNASNVTLSHFCFAADEKFVLQLRVAVASLLWACRKNPRQIVVHVLDLGIGDEAWKDMRDAWRGIMPSAVCERHRIDPSLYAHCKSWHGSVATYARIDLPSILPDVEWCFYFDCDTLVFDDPIVLEGLCRDDIALIGHFDKGETDLAFAQGLGRSIDLSAYVCAGVLLVNLGFLRRSGEHRECLDFLREHPDVPTVDQTVLNIVCRGHIALLPSGWGVFVLDALLEEKCACIHYAGSPDCTPWRSRFSLFHHCFDYPLICVWREFAVRIAKCNLPSLSWADVWHEIAVGCVAKCVVGCLKIARKTGCHPKRFNSLMDKWGKRWSSGVPASCRRILFGGEPTCDRDF